MGPSEVGVLDFLQANVLSPKCARNHRRCDKCRTFIPHVLSRPGNCKCRFIYGKDGIAFSVSLCGTFIFLVGCVINGMEAVSHFEQGSCLEVFLEQ